MSGFLNSLKSLASGVGGAKQHGQDTKMRFSVMPYPGDSGFTQWHDAMKMVARLPGGIPPEFRRRLWLTLAEKHLQARGVNWCHAERFCFNEWSNPDDDELGIQIVKDLHRTGCSLFCGAEAEQNQALLKRVLLAYARWNKAVGYCQGFNMLAALILQVMDRSESDAVKVMIYLIEGVLPESYFANNLRGLSVDMAVFRDLLRLRLPALSRHLEQLQHDARDSATGTSYEPPLTNVFTMQWFLTLFSNCLPQTTVLRVWDLIFLEGNEVLLRTALAIWDGLADRILAVDSADEFYSIMGVLTREMLEFGLMDTNNLVKTIVTIAPFPFPELSELRDKYLYNITPWTQTVSTAAKRGLKLFYSDDDEETDEDEEKIAVAAAYGISTVFRSPRRRVRHYDPLPYLCLLRALLQGSPLASTICQSASDSINRTTSPSTSLSALNYSALAPDKDRLALDISALKQQYAKLRERQRQAHIILTAACARQPLGPSVPTPVAMNHLLLGKSALMSMRGRRVGPPPGAVPPPASASLRPNAKPRKTKQPVVTLQGQLNTPSSDIKTLQSQTDKSGETLHWKDANAKKRVRRSSEDTRRESSTRPADTEEEAEIAPSIIVPAIVEPEIEDEETASSKSNASSDGSSTSTELCDEPDRLSDFDSEDLTSISDASSYAPDIARLSTLPESKSPVSPESTLHFAPSSDESTSSEYKPTSQKEFSRSSSLDKSMDYINEKKEVAISKKTSEDNLDTCVPPLSVNKIHPLVSSSDLHESITIKTCKQISPTKEEILVSSSVERSKASTNQMPAKRSESEKDSHETQLHSGKSEGRFTDSKSRKDSAENVHRLHNPSPSNETATITSQPLYSQVPNDNLSSEPKNYEQLFSIKDKVAQTTVEENLVPSSISIDNIVGGILETELTSVLSGLKDNKRSSPTDDYIIPEGTVKGNVFITKSPDKSLSSIQMEKSLENITDESKGPRDIELKLARNEEILKSPDTSETNNIDDHKERSIDDVDMSVLLEINHRLHCQEKDLQFSLEVLTAELKDSPDKGNNKSEKKIIDYAKMSELLEIDQKMNLGRRNSERALKIIQENSEILQRILQCQARRPSKLSEEGSNGANVHSEDDSTDANSSVPTTSSLENVNIVPSSPSRLSLDDDKPVQKNSDEERDHLLTDNSGSKSGKLEVTDSDFSKDTKKQISLEYQHISNYLEDHKEPTRYNKVFSADSKDSPFHHSTEESTVLTTERKYVTERSSLDHPKHVEEDTLGSLNKFKAKLRPLLLSPEMDNVSAKMISHDPKVSVTRVKLDDLSPLHLQTSQNISEDLHKKHSIFSSTTSDEPLSTRHSYDSKSDIMSLYDQYDFHLFSQKGTPQTSSDLAKTSTKSLYSFEEDMKPINKFSNLTYNYEKYNSRTGDSSGTSFHFQSHIKEKSSHSMELNSTKYSAKSSSPLHQSNRSSFLDSLSFTDRLSAYESSKETKKQSHSITPSYSEISRLDSPPLNIDTLGKETIDYFHLDSSSILSSPTKPGGTAWTDSPRHTHISSPNSRRRESDELFRRRPSSSSPKRRTSEDFQFDLRPFLTSSISDSRTDLVHTKLARESRPSSPIVSECFPEMLNRSSSSSSLHGFHSKSKTDLSSPPPSPFQRYTPPLRRSMSRERPVSLHFDKDISFDLTKESVSHGRTSSPLYKSFSMLSVNETASPFATSYEKLDKSHSRRRISTDYSHSLPRTKGKLSRITSPIYSPTKSKEFNFSLPPLKTPTQSSPIKSPMKFNPFPPRPSMQKPKELGVKLGLYPVTGEGVRGKVLEKST